MRSIFEVSRTLLSLCTPVRGGSPGFTPYHVFEALRMLSREPVGRVSLALRLGIGESSARTLIERLEAHGFIKRSRSGVMVVGKGLELLESISRAITVFDVDLEGLNWGVSKLIVVWGFKPPRDLVGVFKIRDYIVAEGCREAIIGGFSNGTLSYPGMPEEVWRIVSAKIPGDALRGEALHVIVPQAKLGEAFNGIIRMLSETKYS